MKSNLTKIQKTQTIDCLTWLPNNLLIKLDRCLMAHGIEGRTPFVDVEVARHFFNFDDSFKVQKGSGKWILRKWLDINFPECEPFSKKRGFNVPVTEWLQGKSKILSELVPQQEGIKRFFHPANVQDLINGINKKNSYVVWTLLAFSLWHKCHIEGRPAEGSTFDFLNA